MSSHNDNRRRDPAGKYATEARAAADFDDVVIGGEDAGPPAPPPVYDPADPRHPWDDPDAPSLSDIMEADAERLWAYVRHPDPIVRADAASSPAATPDQLAELADPATQPFIVRSNVALLPDPDYAEMAADDPDPVIRHIALHSGSISGRTRSRLSRDLELARIDDMLAAAV